SRSTRKSSKTPAGSTATSSRPALPATRSQGSSSPTTPGRRRRVLRYLARRLATMVPLVLGTTLLVFALGRLAPGDPVQILVGDRGDATWIARARAQVGLDRPLVEQSVRFLGRLGRLDLGVSYAYPGKPVGDLLAGAVSTSLMLGVLGVAVALVLGLPLGILAALRPGGWIDRLARGVSLLGIAVPFFVVAAALVLLFSLRLGWL